MRILLIEDDLNICESLIFQFEKEGFTIDAYHTGDEGLFYIKEQIHDVVLLDRMLPELDGLEVLKQTRNLGISTPIILITALSELNDKITGLDCGADDYVVKPFAFEELLARIRSINRRPRLWEDAVTLQFGDIILDVTQKQLSNDNKNCSLSKKETDLIEMFLRNPNQILPRNILLARVWGPDGEVEDGNLDNYIHFLRRRLKSLKSTLIIKTIRGTGYRLEKTDV